MRHYSIAIDGPAGAGKSTVARAVAQKLSFIYVDTGAMYRAMGLYLHRLHIKPSDTFAAGQAAEGAEISITYQDGEQQVLLSGENVTAQIRTEEAGKLASGFAACPEIRKKLVELQKQLARQENVVMDGRDIGTKVLPDADLKIYLTAGTKERAKRRFTELRAKGISASLAEVEKDIAERDAFDMQREESPLCQAEDAVYTDCSAMTAQEVADYIIQLFQERKTAIAD